MKQSVRRALLGACVTGAVGACVVGVAGVASAVPGASAVASKPSAPATAAAYVPPSKPLNYGQSGAAVKSVQRRLTALHYYPGPVDGKYGMDLQEAAWAFRETQGLRVTQANNNHPITKAFLKALVHPKAPKVLVPKGGANRVEVNQNIQVLVVYKDNKINLVAHVSTGGRYYYPCPGGGGTCGPAITPDGNYHALSYIPGWVTVPLGQMYNPTFFIGYAYAIHGDDPVPWYPASHGCVRVWMDIAQFFHKRVTVGGKHPTPIYVRGTAPAYPASN
jgi:lipoprotein-anchoring transpeptidase ErfK/SrfK